ncbi:MAG: hypothetical protein JW913_09555 [Chitinispirillaceae bacterium]|nr:hypothetical protein [Chitinispirillaceae bacterium]
MRTTTTVCFLVSMLVGLPAASDSSSAANKPELVVQPSKYVEILDAVIGSSDGSMVFEGHFIVLGRGVFGHFDFVAYDDSGEVIQLTKSDDRAYVKDNGARVKSIDMNLGPVDKCEKVEVSFHEMRMEPDSGACFSKQ